VVKQNEIGRMRLQWWRDAVAAIGPQDSAEPAPPGGRADLLGNPVVLCLHKTLRLHRCSRRWLYRLVDERVRRFDDFRFASIAELEAYAEATSSSVLYASMECAGATTLDGDHAASHVGKAIGLANAIRSVPFHARHGRLPIPMETLAASGAVEQDFLRGESTQAVKDAVFAVASQAHLHLEHARTLTPKLAGPAKNLLLPAVPTQAFLTRLQAAHFDPFDKSVIAPHWRLPFTLLRHRIKGTF